MQTRDTHSSRSGYRDGHKEEVQLCGIELADERNVSLGISSFPAIYMITCPRDIPQGKQRLGKRQKYIILYGQKSLCTARFKARKEARKCIYEMKM